MTFAVTGLARPPMLGETSFTLAPGTLAALVGPNGAGKTTLLAAIAGLTSGPGAVTLGGQLLTPFAFAFLPASREAPFPISAAEIVALGLNPPRRESGGEGDQPQAGGGAVARALARTDTAHLAARPLTRLSTGERARVLLARALVAAPALLLLDEPTANLDPAHALLVIALLREEAARGAIVLIATHDLALARAHADRLLVMQCGRIHADGPPARALCADTLAHVFAVRDGPQGFTPTWRFSRPGHRS